MIELKYLGDDVSYPVSFSWIHYDNVVQVLGDLPVKETGFELSRSGFEDHADYSDFTTVYRTLDNGIQFSNDGSHYIPPTKNVVIKAMWDDADNRKELRPDSITVTVFKNSEEYETKELRADNDYTFIYENVLASDTYSIETDDIEYYQKSFKGTTVSFALNVKDILVSVIFTGGYTELPESVDVDVFDGEVKMETISLTADDEWQHLYENVSIDSEYSVIGEDITGFRKSTNGTSIVYEYNGSSSDLEQRLAAVENDIKAIDDAIGGSIE